MLKAPVHSRRQIVATFLPSTSISSSGTRMQGREASARMQDSLYVKNVIQFDLRSSFVLRRCPTSKSEAEAGMRFRIRKCSSWIFRGCNFASQLSLAIFTKLVGLRTKCQKKRFGSHPTNGSRLHRDGFLFPTHSRGAALSAS